MLKVVDEVKQPAPSNLKISISSPDSNYNYVTKAVTGQLLPLPRVAKDNNVMTSMLKPFLQNLLHK